MSSPSLRNHPQPTFDHGLDRFVFGFDTDAGTGVGLMNTLPAITRPTVTLEYLFKKHTTTRLAWRRCYVPAVGLLKGMS
jgi:hypothetical protein